MLHPHLHTSFVIVLARTANTACENPEQRRADNANGEESAGQSEIESLVFLKGR